MVSIGGPYYLHANIKLFQITKQWLPVPEEVRVRAARQTTGRHRGQTLSRLNSRNSQLVSTQHQQAVYRERGA
jgi:hypothetical protein